MSQIKSSYTLSTTTELPFADAVARIREELAQQGFGVLCEIDVAAQLRAKLGVERDPYLILGACNPSYAHQALEAESELGALLPCNVVVYERDGETRVAAIDPRQMLSIVGNPALEPIAGEIRRRLEFVVERVAAAAPS